MKTIIDAKDALDKALAALIEADRSFRDAREYEQQVISSRITAENRRNDARKAYEAARDALEKALP